MADERPGVRITGVEIPFMDLMGLMVKASFAAIPAAIIVGLVWLVLVGVIGSMR